MRDFLLTVTKTIDKTIKLLVLCCVHSAGGLILDKTVSDPRFEGMAVFTPIINGRCTSPGCFFPLALLCKHHYIGKQVKSAQAEPGQC